MTGVWTSPDDNYWELVQRASRLLLSIGPSPVRRFMKSSSMFGKAGSPVLGASAGAERCFTGGRVGAFSAADWTDTYVPSTVKGCCMHAQAES